VYPYLVERSPLLIDNESVVAASISISCTVTPRARASLNKVVKTSSGNFTNVPADFFFWVSLIQFSPSGLIVGGGFSLFSFPLIVKFYPFT